MSAIDHNRLLFGRTDFVMAVTNGIIRDMKSAGNMAAVKLGFTAHINNNRPLSCAREGMQFLACHPPRTGRTTGEHRHNANTKSYKKKGVVF